MQIVSGADYARKVHYKAPPSHQISHEMQQFLYWFNRTFPQGAAPLPPVTRAGIAHLWFESIHPFEDGNGRIGRAIAEKALAQSMSTPILTAIASTLLRRQKEYYKALHQASFGLDITEWLVWFSSIALEAQQRSTTLVNFIIKKTKLMHSLQGLLNTRQEKALLRMFREGPEGFKGGLSASNYLKITGASPATARRDLNSLVEMGALIRTGDNKGTRYHLNIPA